MASYLLRNRNGNYYSRVPFPLELKQLGFPRELRMSLLTKDRAIASFRNLMAAHGIKSLIEGFRVNEELLEKVREKREKFRINEMVEPYLEALRKEMQATILERNRAAKKAEKEVETLQTQLIEAQIKQQATVAKVKTVVEAVKHKAKIDLEAAKQERKITENIQHQLSGVREQLTLEQLQTEFIKRKQADDITIRSLRQLKTRTSAFVEFAGKDCFVHDVRFKEADAFLHYLSTSQNLTDKTIKDYKAASSQMLAYATKMEYTNTNPFENIRVKGGNAKPRERWSRPQLKKLLSSPNFTEHACKNIDDFWIPLIMLFTGARPAEICQLQTSDVVNQDNFLCLSISEDGDEQSIKTGNAKRLVPIHSKLLDLGFHQFVDQRRSQGSTQLFACKATGEYKEWAKNFERRFDRYLNKLGFIAGQRPTSYSFRHTMVDELQQLDISEHVVADLVGHSKKGFTFQHYGKRTPLKRLKEVIESLNFKDELDAVTSPYLSR